MALREEGEILCVNRVLRFQPMVLREIGDIGDVGMPEESQPVRIGQGPAITVADRSIIVSRRMIQALERAAAEMNIAYQYKLPAYGGTDAGVIHLSGAGVLSGVLSVPCRFIHSPNSTLCVRDLEDTICLVTGFVQTLPGSLSV